MLRIGIIGYGYWGPNMVRNFSALNNCIVSYVADNRQERLKDIQKIYPGIQVTTIADEIINSNKIDAVVIATPVSTHYSLAKAALLNGKHVLLEKPMTSSAAESKELIDIANQKKLTLMVDHTFLYTGAVQKIKSLIDDSILGELKYFDSTRINLGLFQPDINVLWDLAPHDLSILLYLTKEKPYSINAIGISHTNNNIENIGYLTINYTNNFIAHFTCSWASPLKVRSTLIGGSKKMILYNDIEPSEKIRIYDTQYIHKTDEDKKRILVDYRIGDVNIPKLSTHEALTEVAKDFIQSIMQQTKPIAHAELGLEVVSILEMAELSIKNKGVEVKF